MKTQLIRIDVGSCTAGRARVVIATVPHHQSFASTPPSLAPRVWALDRCTFTSAQATRIR